MNPTNDYVFRRIFGQVGNEEITKGLIGSIISKDIENIKLDESPITEQNIQDDKICVLDIKARLNNDILCDVEMQVTKDKNIDKRIMFYWSKLYSSEIHKGEDYIELHKTIVILIADFQLNNLKEIPKFHTKWQIREEKYRKILLTDTLEIHIIELPKLLKRLKNNTGIKSDEVTIWSSFLLDPEEIGDESMNENEDEAIKKANEEKLVLWSMFLLNPNVLSEEDLQNNEDIRKAKEELEKLRQNKKVQRLAELRVKHILDQNSIRRSALEEGFEEGYENGLEKGLERGLEQGLEQGLERGIEQGKKKSLLEIASKLLNSQMPIEQIIQITGLTEEEIKSIN